MYNNLMRKALLLVGAVLVFITTVWVIVSAIQSHKAAEKTAKTFISLMHKREAQAAYDMTTARFKEQVPLDSFKGALSNEESIKGLALVREDKVSPDSKAYEASSSPKIYVFDIDTQSSKYRARVVVLKSDNEWKIDEYSRTFR